MATEITLDEICTFRLFFKSNDTGSNVGKAPFIRSQSPGVRVSLVVRECRNDCCIAFTIDASQQGLIQGNFNNLNDSASGNCVGFLTGTSFQFVPREGFAYYNVTGNTISAFLVGERPSYF